MSPVFNQEDSTTKKTVMIMFWVFCAAVALLVAKAVLAGIAALIPAVVWIGPALWVYWHAQKHDVAKPFLWALLTLFTWVIGLVVYLIAHSDDSAIALCPTCGSRVKRQYQKCPQCGGPLTSTRAKCPSCGRKLEPSWEFCARCGASIPRPERPSSLEMPGPVES